MKKKKSSLNTKIKIGLNGYENISKRRSVTLKLFLILI